MHKNYDIHLVILLLQCLRVYLGQYQCCKNKDCSEIDNCQLSKCLIAIQRNEAYRNKKTINITQGLNATYGCWPWVHELSACPKIKNQCRLSHDGTYLKIFCCNGELCNKFNHRLCDHFDTVTETVTETPIMSRKPIINPNQTNFSKFHIFILILTVIFLFLIGIVVWIFMKYSGIKRFRKLFMRKDRHFNSVSKGLLYKLDTKNSSVQQSIFIDNASKYYEKSVKIGSGKFGEVWLGNLTMPKNSNSVSSPLTQEITENCATNNLPAQVAIKIFQDRNEQSWRKEIEIYRYIKNKCPQILHVIGFDQLKWDDTNILQQKQECWLLTTHMNQSSLADCLQLTISSSTRPTWSQVVSVCKDISAGLSYLHEDRAYRTNNSVSDTCVVVPGDDASPSVVNFTAANHNDNTIHKPSIAHRDLKSKNVLIADNWSRVCIADMGLAVCFHPNRSLPDLKTQVGTHRYMSPEVLEGVIKFTRDAFLAIDVYAMALVMWEVMSQSCINIDNCDNQPQPYAQPFQRELGHNVSIEILQDWVIAKKKRPDFPKHLQEFEPARLLWKTIEECWDEEAEARLTSSCVYERLQQLALSPDLDVV